MFEMYPDEDVVFAVVFDVHRRAAAQDELGDDSWCPQVAIRFAVVDADDIDW